MIGMDSIRDNYGEFIDSCYADERGYRLTKKSDISSYALCFAIFGKHLVGDNIFLSENKNLFDSLLRENIYKKKFKYPLITILFSLFSIDF